MRPLSHSLPPPAGGLHCALFCGQGCLAGCARVANLAVTGLSRFEIPVDPASGNSATPLPKSSFAVSIALTNLGRSPVSISGSGNAEADAFIVTLLDPAGEVVWTSDASVARALVLAPRATLRRTLRVPLKTSDGQWLTSGRHTLRAETGLGEALAQVPIDIVNPWRPEGTGIQGQVFCKEFGPFIGGLGGVGGTTSDRVPIPATVSISEIREPNAKHDHPPFTWHGPTDGEGHFKVATPAGRFSFSLHSNYVLEPNYLLPLSRPPVSVTAGQFSTQNFFIEGTLLLAKESIASVKSATVEPFNVEPFFHSLRITASGLVPSSGWRNPQLVRRESTEPGVFEFDFVALPPSGPVTWAFEPINAQTVIYISGPWTAVHVRAQNGTITATSVTTAQP